MSSLLDLLDLPQSPESRFIRWLEPSLCAHSNTGKANAAYIISDTAFITSFKSTKIVPKSLLIIALERTEIASELSTALFHYSNGMWENPYPVKQADQQCNPERFDNIHDLIKFFLRQTSKKLGVEKNTVDDETGAAAVDFFFDNPPKKLGVEKAELGDKTCDQLSKLCPDGIFDISKQIAAFNEETRRIQLQSAPALATLLTLGMFAMFVGVKNNLPRAEILAIFPALLEYCKAEPHHGMNRSNRIPIVALPDLNFQHEQHLKEPGPQAEPAADDVVIIGSSHTSGTLQVCRAITVAMPQASETDRTTISTVETAWEAIINAIRSGVSAHDLHAFGRKRLDHGGIPEAVVRCYFTDRSHISPAFKGNQTLEAGRVLTVSVTIRGAERDRFAFSGTVEVTVDGNRPLYDDGFWDKASELLEKGKISASPGSIAEAAKTILLDRKEPAPPNRGGWWSDFIKPSFLDKFLLADL